MLRDVMLKHYYVYALVDPRTEQPFYIGKGKGARISYHETEALGKNNSAKLHRIREIWAAEQQVTRRVLAHFCDEAEAYKFEAQVIAKIGLQNLTNIMPGGGSSAPKPRTVRPWSYAALKEIAPKIARVIREKLLGNGRLYFLHTEIDLTDAIAKIIRLFCAHLGYTVVKTEVQKYLPKTIPCELIWNSDPQNMALCG